MANENRFFDSLGKDNVTIIPGGAHIEGALKLDDSYQVNEYFDTQPVVCGKVLANGSTMAFAAPTGATGDENMLMLNYSTWEYHILGTQDILAPTMGTGGLNIAMDQTNDDGVELCLGINAANRGVFVVGTAPAFFARMRFTIGDVSGTDDCAFGFRKVEAYQANLDDYEEMACLNVISGDIKIETILNDGSTTTTDTTDNWADAAEHELEVRVSAAGVVSYKIDGRDPTTTATTAFTFDDDEVVVPFFYFLNAANLVDTLVLKEFECGLQ